MQNRRDTGQEGHRTARMQDSLGYKTGKMQELRDAGGGVQERRDPGMVGCRKGGMQERRDTGNEGCRKGGMQDRRDGDRKDAVQEGCRTGGIQDMWDAEQV